MEATVIVDAFPDRPFRGTVEKIEPQAVVQQNVTMFPVLVSLENRDGSLMPGMNGEVAIVSERRENVLAIPNESIRNVREAARPRRCSASTPTACRRRSAQRWAAWAGGFGGGMGGARPGAGRQQHVMGANGRRASGAGLHAGLRRPRFRSSRVGRVGAGGRLRRPAP
jgi:HlyD family secretion protein